MLFLWPSKHNRLLTTDTYKYLGTEGRDGPSIKLGRYNTALRTDGNTYLGLPCIPRLADGDDASGFYEGAHGDEF